jgi:hypothetical protein
MKTTVALLCVAIGAIASAQTSLVPQTLTVPSGLRAAPFNVTRTLNVPPGFDAAVFARVPSPRFMAFAPNGDLLVSIPTAAKCASSAKTPPARSRRSART